MSSSSVFKFSGLLLSVLILLSVAACNSQKRYDYSSSSRTLPKAKYGSIYIVKRGDTLYSIGWAIKQDYKNVARWNGIRPPYLISPGQRLRMYPPSKKSSAKSNSSASKSVIKAKHLRVRSSDGAGRQLAGKLHPASSHQ